MVLRGWPLRRRGGGALDRKWTPERLEEIGHIRWGATRGAITSALAAPKKERDDKCSLVWVLVCRPPNAVAVHCNLTCCEMPTTFLGVTRLCGAQID